MSKGNERQQATLYVRLSEIEEGKGTEGAGMERQEEDARAWCARNGVEVVAVHHDPDTSAWKRTVERDGFEDAVADLHAGRANVLVAYRTDRLSRHGVDSLTDMSEDLGVRIVCVGDGVDVHPDGTGALTFGVLGVVARQESRTISNRVKRATNQRATHGGYHGGMRPFGYHRPTKHRRPKDEAGKIVRTEGFLPCPTCGSPEVDGLCEPEAAEVRQMADRLLAGWTLNQIAGDLNTRGVLSARAGIESKIRKGSRKGERKVASGLWSASTVSSLLRSPQTGGFRQHGAERVRGTWEPALDEEMWLAVQERLAGNTPTLRGRRGGGLLSGLATCGLCGAHLRRSSSARPSEPARLVCPKGPGRKGCGKVGAAAYRVEETAGDLLCHALAYLGAVTVEEAVARQAAAVASEEGDLDELERRLGQVRESLIELSRERFADRSLSKTEYDAVAGPLRDEEKDLADRVDRIRATMAGAKVAAGTLAGHHDDPWSWWQSIDHEEKRRNLLAAAGEVIVAPVGRSNGNRWNPGRVSLKPRWAWFEAALPPAPEADEAA